MDLTEAEDTKNMWQKYTESESRSVMSDSFWSHELYTPWNSPGQNIGVGSLSLLQGIFPTQESQKNYTRKIFMTEITTMVGSLT